MTTHAIPEDTAACASLGNAVRPAGSTRTPFSSDLREWIASRSWSLLFDCIISGEEYLNIHAQARRRFLSCGSLLSLVIIVICNQGDDEMEFLHVP